MSSSKREKAETVSKRVLVPISDGSEEIEALTVIDVLRRTGMTEVVVASVPLGGEDPLAVICSHGVKILCDAVIDDAVKEEFDAVVIPGGMPGAKNLQGSKPLTEFLRSSVNKEGFLLGAICAAPFVVLFENGLLKDVPRATAYPGFGEKMGGIFVEDRVVVSQSGSKGATVVTSRGPGTAMDFSIKLVEILCGEEKAQQLSKALLLTTKA